MSDVEKRQDRSPVPSSFDYAPAPEARDLVQLEPRYGLFVGGEWVEPRSGEYETSISPATEEPLAEFAYAGEEDVDVAVQTARDAFENGWSELPTSERAKRRASGIYETTKKVFELAAAEGVPAALAADRLAEQRMREVGRLRGIWLNA